MSDVTVVLTSCNRPDLLQKTLDSFFIMNTYSLERFIIIDDSMQIGCNDFVKERYPFPIELIYNSTKLFQIRSIDTAYSMVTTPYIFHMEEDWQFVKSGFIEASKPVLEAAENVVQVWLRGLDDTTLQHPCLPGTYEVDGNQLVVVDYNGVWNGFSFNPSLKRLSDWKLLPNGYDGIPRLTRPDVTLEVDISIHYGKQKMIAMRFIESYVTHIGWNRHVHDLPTT
jgi:hypothetical protein